MIKPTLYHGLPRRLGDYWGGFVGDEPQTRDWRASVDELTGVFRGYLSERLCAKAPPEDVEERLRTWIEQDANLWALSEWLEAGKGWKTDVETEAERAFAKAFNGTRRRFYLARLEAAAQRNRNAATLLKDTARRDAVLNRLADPRKPMTREPTPYKLAPRRAGLPEGQKLALFLPFPGLTEGEPVPDFCRVRPNMPFRGPLPDPLPEHWVVSPALALDTLKGLLGWNDWELLSAFVSDEPGERWLRVLAWAWLDERLGSALETRAAKPMRPRATGTGGREWARLPKVAGGLSWAMGGQGVTVELDGHTFSSAPGMGARGQLQRANMPPGYALLPANHARRPHQTALPIDAGEDAPPLAVAVAGATQYALTAAAGKLGLYVMASSLDGTPRKTTLRELTRAINPGARLVATHYNTAAAGLVELANLRLFMPSGWAHAVFYMPALPWKELDPDQYDAPLVAGMDPALVNLLLAKENPATTPFRGWFLVDLTGAMGLPTKQAGLLRQYLRTAATWNAYWEPGKGPDPGRIPTIQTEQWAALVNALPLAAVDYLQAGRHKPQGRNRLSEAISKVLDEVEDLQARGLVVIDRATRKEIRLLPPEIYLEAWRDAKKGGRQKPLEP
jgi:hypothetical protein